MSSNPTNPSGPQVSRDSANGFDLDLSLLAPVVEEKDALPAIIVTPCTPSCPTDYEIAFIAGQDQSKEPYDSADYEFYTHNYRPSFFETLRHRSNRRARALLCLALPALAIAGHILLNRFLYAQPSEARAGNDSAGWHVPF